jgi:hypothetical protein
LLCRSADTLEDAWHVPADRSRFSRFLAALEGDPAAARALAAEASSAPPRSDLELVAHLPRVLRLLASFPSLRAKR